MAGESTDSKVDPAFVISLHGHYVKVSSKSANIPSAGTL